MESEEKEKNISSSDGEAIISGIEADAKTEEHQIIKQADEQAAEKKKYTDKKIESMLKDAEKQAQEQAENAKKKILSGVQLEIKRRSMKIHGDVMRDILKRVEKKMESMIDDSNYINILSNWITEAGIGLDADSAQINASKKELALIDEKLISKVIDQIRKKTNKQITLQLSDAQPLQSQGVVLTSADGHTAYNNQVKTRMSRKEREIRMTLYKTLFTEDRKE